MSSKWWTNGGGDNDFENTNNWSLTEGGVGGAGVPGASDNAYYSDTSSTANCTLSDNVSITNLTNRFNIHGGSDDYHHTVTVGTYDLTVSGYINVRGTNTSNKFGMVIGVSANTGVTVDTFGIYNGFVSLNMQNTSKINCNNFHLAPNVYSVFTTNGKGIYTHMGNGTFRNDTGNNCFRTFIINNGVTMTVSTGTTGYTVLSTLGTASTFTLNGTLTIDGTAYLSGYNFTYGASSDITGAGTLNYEQDNTTNFTVSKVGALSFTGTVNIPGSSTNRLMMIGNFSNANYTLTGRTGGSSAFYGSVGTIYTTNFTVTNANNTAISVTNNVANPSFSISGNVDLNAGTGTYNTTWNAGSGTQTLTGTSKTADYNDQTIENLTVSGSYSMTGGYTTTTGTYTGTVTFDATKTYNHTNIAGNGTLTSLTGDVVFLYYTGTDSFTGTLTNVVLVKSPKIPANNKGIGAYIGLKI